VTKELWLLENPATGKPEFSTAPTLEENTPLTLDMQPWMRLGSSATGAHDGTYWAGEACGTDGCSVSSGGMDGGGE
jgi:hypothetical protein